MRGMMMAAAVLLAGPAMADIERVQADGSVEEVMARLETAVEGAGATVFARVDHARGAESVGMDLKPMQLLIFGNPKLGTPALQDAAEAGLRLPMKVLVYEGEDGQVWLAWEDPEDMLEEVGVDDDLEVIEKMEDALETLTGKAAKAGG